MRRTKLEDSGYEIVSLSKLNIKIVKTWTLFSNKVNTTIRKYSLRAFIWVVTPASLYSSGFRSYLGLVKFCFLALKGLDKNCLQAWTSVLININKPKISCTKFSTSCCLLSVSWEDNIVLSINMRVSSLHAKIQKIPEGFKFSIYQYFFF